ncbi:aspartate aminotransferase family protein [Priestia endophytica]|uniref:aspartate aminotransferase family protein n=1 Tax=Priestia endophytica TaxID=135735 RepID=UPI000DCA757A|nr:aspartate aminotransferase family protein [Priestia endophytica]RAS72786.1 aspartate aminotransferase family protein [Priestia endophytica]
MKVKENQTIQQKDEELIWHGMRPANTFPSMIVEQASGAWIKDIDGNEYLDGMSGIWCVNVGYGRKEIADKVYQQLLGMPFYPLTQSHKPAIELAEKLNEWLDGDYVYFFSNSGSEANETAFKIARQYHHQKGEQSRNKVISRYRSYHGNTMATLSAGGQAQRKFKYEPLTQGFIHVSPPDNYRCPDYLNEAEYNLACADEIDKAITWEMKETIAAVIMEPIITGGGILVPHDNYLKRVREICDENDVLMIVDEVICGFGRTGKPFGFMHYDVKPDIITMAKGITSGYMPLSVTAVKKEVYEAFKGSDQYDHFRHVNTFGGSPASCAAAIQNLEIMERENLVKRSAELGERMLEELKVLKSLLPNVGDVRGKGLLIGIELVESKETKKPLEESIVKSIVAACKKQGLIIGKTADTVAGYNNILQICPPLNITEDDFEKIVTTVKAVLTEQLGA